MEETLSTDVQVTKDKNHILNVQNTPKYANEWTYVGMKKRKGKNIYQISDSEETVVKET